jgi:hypothetical protein
LVISLFFEFFPIQLPCETENEYNLTQLKRNIIFIHTLAYKGSSSSSVIIFSSVGLFDFLIVVKVEHYHHLLSNYQMDVPYLHRLLLMMEVILNEYREQQVYLIDRLKVQLLMNDLFDRMNLF